MSYQTEASSSLLKIDQIGSLVVCTDGFDGYFRTKVIDKHLGPVWLEEYNSLDKAIAGHGEAIAYAKEGQL